MNEKRVTETPKRKSRKKRIILFSLLGAFLVLIAVCLIYLCTYYPADDEAIAAFGKVCATEFEDEDGNTILAPSTDANVGFIFYPGGKVEADSYLPFMRSLAEKGIFCVLVDMPFNLAVFDTGAAKQPIERYSHIDKWYIGGHSLGGSMAADFASKNTDRIDGVILLAAYSTADISDLSALSVYGSEDEVMNAEKYEKYKSNLPSHLDEHIIEGGCHAYFGMYGEQDGDGEASISPEEQIIITSGLVSDFIMK